MNGEAMRGRLAAGAMLAALLLNVALAGCGSGLPDGADGALADDWVPMAQVKGYVPPVGVCIDDWPAATAGSANDVVPCDKPHHIEVVHVGTFPGDVKPGPAQRAAAYAECDTQAKLYLGRPWSEGRLQLHLTVPRDAAWDGGARWFRCDVVEVLWANWDNSWTTRVGSLKQGFPAALLVSCANAVVKAGYFDSMKEVPCATSHNAEYVGYFRADQTMPYPKSQRQWDAIYRRCGELAAGYLGISQTLWYRVPALAWIAYPESWAAGDRRVRCALYYGGAKLKKSVKGGKGKGLPRW